MASKEDRRVALVTGGSGDIGAAVSRRLAHDGFAVAINYAGNAAAAETLVRQIEDAGGRAQAVQADVTNSADVGRMFGVVEDTFGGLDVLITAAGAMPLANIVDVDDACFDRVIAINLKGAFYAMREGAKRIRSGGRIITFSSTMVGLLMPTYAIYAAAKAGVETMTRILSKELRGRNITVNTIAPGPIASSLFFKGKTQEVIDRFAKGPPLERLGTPDDVASAVSFLAGPDSAWVNGQVLRANGGII